MRSPDELTELFRASGRKVTAQRQCIFRILQDDETHPSAEAVHAVAVREMETISLKTVYQTLNDLAELGIDQSDFWNVVQTILREIQACGPESCYAGGQPPTKAYEPEIKDEELWAYAWSSCTFGFQTYIKFVMRKNARGEWVYLHVRLHKDSP